MSDQSLEKRWIHDWRTTFMKSSTPGITPGTGLGGPNVLVGLLFRYIITFLPPFAQPEHAGAHGAHHRGDPDGRVAEDRGYYDERAARCSAPRARL